MPNTQRQWITVTFALALLALLRGLPHQAAAAEPDEKPLVDFSKPETIQLTPNGAAGGFVKIAGNAKLAVTTEAGLSYPSLRIEPKAGGWNLAEYEQVAAEITNPEQTPVRVLMAVNNPGSTGVEKCSVASLTLGPGEKGTLAVALGIWHGEAKLLDRANIVSFDILLDKPTRAHHFYVDDVRAVRARRFDLAEAERDPFFKELKPPFGRGINLGNALEAPNEGEWGVTLEADYFRVIKEAGFDSIRLPVKWSNHAERSSPYTIEPRFFARVDWAVEQALSNGLQVVLNVHHYSEMDENPDAHRTRLIGLWERIAAHYKDKPATLAFELLNEPHDKLTAAKWNSILLEALAAVRKTNPTRTVVIGPVAWNSIGELKSLELPEADRNLVVTVHYYGPFTFTHQGAHWIDAKNRPPLGTPWKGTDAERAAITKELDAAAGWGLKHRRPIYLGEFGAMKTADLDSRVRWTKFIAEECANRKIGYAYWEFCSGFGAYDSTKREWTAPLRDALVPK